MEPGRGRRLTISRLMAVVVVVAILCWLPRLQNPSEITGWLVLVCAISVFVVTSVLFDSFVGYKCPGCSQYSLNRLARNWRYFRCSGCGMRLKRSILGPWQDASGPKDEKIYRRKPGAAKWQGFSAPEHLDGTTSGALLRNKRQRQEPDA